MDVFVCPRDWTHSTTRFVPTHMVSLQDPKRDLSGLRPPWIPEENHHVSRFFDMDIPESELAPTRQQVEVLLDWLEPRCGADSKFRFLIHCDAGLGRSTATGYLAWALHLGVGSERLAFDSMVKSALESRLIPNSVIVAHADELLGRKGTLKAPLTEWNHRVSWRRTLR